MKERVYSCNLCIISIHEQWVRGCSSALEMRIIHGNFLFISLIHDCTQFMVTICVTDLPFLEESANFPDQKDIANETS